MSGPPAAIPRDTTDGATPEGGLFEALEGHLSRSPEDPALFYPEGLDVRWRSWRALAAQAAAGAAALGAVGVGAGDGVAFRWRCHPDAVAADLAVQWAGGVSTPAAGAAEAGPWGCAAWLLQPGEERPAEGLWVAALPEPELPWERRGAPDLPAPSASRGGGARVIESATAAAARRFSPAEIVSGARELGVRLAVAAAETDAAAGTGRRRGREIVLANLDLRARDGRTLLTWGLLTGAALFLEPDPRALPASTAWARPTLVAAEAAPLIELARQLRRHVDGRLGRKLRRRKGPAYPFGRLRLVVVLGGGRLPVDDVPFWAERGVVVLRG
jgi:hypothetical protein